MSKVAIKGNASGTGTFTLEAPNSNTDRTLVLPDEAGTVLTSASSITQNSGPAFSARQNSSTSFPNNTAVKVLFAVEDFDTNNNFASSTFTPTVEGYYQINAKVAFSVNSSNTRFISLYKNGSKVVDIGVGLAGSLNFAEISGSYLIYMNGTTDYLEIYGFQNSGSTLTSDGTANTYFQSSLVRAA